MELIDKIKDKLSKEEPEIIEEFIKVQKGLTALFKRKNKDYGSKSGKSVAEQMFDRYGDDYFVQMIMQKALRIESLNKSNTINFESVEDSYKDIANYAIMAIIFHKNMR